MLASESKPLAQGEYFHALQIAMVECGADMRTVFVGQAVACEGTTMSPTFSGVSMVQRIEFPVAEDMQMGFCTGLALQGFVPVAVYPRWDFLLLAANQLILHLDRLPLYSEGGYKPKVIIRVAVPAVSEKFSAGVQHDDDFTEAFVRMLRTVKVWKLPHAEMIVPAYRDAMAADHSTVLVEYTAKYREGVA